MKTSFLSQCIIRVFLALTAFSVSWAVDVNGPYKNGQTSIEYVVNQDGSVSLYGINGRDNPTDADGVYMLYNTVQEGQSFWETHEFQNAQGQPLTDGYPVLLSRNNAPVPNEPDHYYSVSAITQDNYVYSARRNSPFQWFTFDAAHNLTTDRPTQVAWCWSHPEYQFLGLNTFRDPPTERLNPTMKTTEGWQTAIQSNPWLQLWPDVTPIVYAVAMADFPNVNKAIAVLCKNDTWNLSHQCRQVICRPISDPNSCPMYCTMDQGETWHPMNGLILNGDRNIQVAITKGAPQGDNSLVYVMYSNSLGDTYLTWARWIGDQFFWHDPFVQVRMDVELQGGFPGIQRTQAMDLAATTSLDGTVTLAVATNHGFYYATHNGWDDEIQCIPRNGTDGLTLEASSLWDVALNPLNPSVEYAVAGPAGCYQTFDKGGHWVPIYNDGQFFTKAQGGARQSATRLVTCYTELGPKHIHWGGGHDIDAYEVFVQTGPRQCGPNPTGRLAEVKRVGFATYSNPRPRMTYSPIGHVFYIAYPDLFCGLENEETHGIVAVSYDDGETWTRGQWTNFQFHTPDFANDMAPQPWSIVADPFRPLRAYVTFANPNDHPDPVFPQFVPPFALTEDRGLNWIVPGNIGLPTEWNGQEPHYAVAAGQASAGQNILWLTGGVELWPDPLENKLWYSLNDGTDWQVTRPMPEQWQQVNGISCQPIRANEVTLSAPEGLAVYSMNSQQWFMMPIPVPRPLQSDGVTQFIADPDLWGVYWVSVESDGLAQIYAVKRSPAQTFWVHLADWEGDNRPVETDLGLERVVNGGPVQRRLFWSAADMPYSSGESMTVEAPVRYFEYPVFPSTVDQTITISDPVVYMLSSVDVSSTATLTFAPGVTVYAAPGCSLRVSGSLVGSAGCRFKALDSTSASTRWGGIDVYGSASLTGCEIRDAITGVKAFKPSGVIAVCGCNIHDNETGVYTYLTQGCPGSISIEGNEISLNDKVGIEVFATTKVSIDGNHIHDNGSNGILLTNSYTEISNNEFEKNGTLSGGYGVKCFGSSPVLYCNEFANNISGEMALYNKSYPVLWKAKDQVGGSNTFLNSKKTLITMSESYPVITKGGNNFYLGTTGYFLEDKSKVPPKHDITNNYWNPTLSLGLLYPSSSSVWVWSGTLSSSVTCGSAAGTGSPSGAGVAFNTGIDAEMDGNLTIALASYEQEIADYPDESWASASAARIFDVQRQLNVDYATRQEYFETLADSSTEYPMLSEAATAFATRLWVEELDFSPALVTYESLVADTSVEAIDSLYAVIDHELTLVRSENEGSGNGLDSDDGIIADPTRLTAMLDGLDGILPSAPEVVHNGYVLPPTEYALHQNYPNPFNPSTTIQFSLPEDVDVQIYIYNTLGQQVTTLVNSRFPVGTHSIMWNGNDASGRSVATGMYIYQIKAGSFVDAKKMLLLK
jgi:parallel beta-helix repeat protein